jgi:hypothetical protein
LEDKGTRLGDQSLEFRRERKAVKMIRALLISEIVGDQINRYSTQADRWAAKD